MAQAKNTAIWSYFCFWIARRSFGQFCSSFLKKSVTLSIDTRFISQIMSINNSENDKVDYFCVWVESQNQNFKFNSFITLTYWLLAQRLTEFCKLCKPNQKYLLNACMDRFCIRGFVIQKVVPVAVIGQEYMVHILVQRRKGMDP